MVQDPLTIVHCFSARLCGLRNYRKKRDEALCESAVHGMYRGYVGVFDPTLAVRLRFGACLLAIESP
jgi:hypothetical protein